MKQTAIIINNFNRLTSTRNMYDFLKNRDYQNITILDNNSSYPPLLEWYQSLPSNELIRFPANIGAHCLFDSGYIDKINSEYIVYSDSDLELNPEMPDDFLEVMKEKLLKYNERKIGLALRIDDVSENCYRNFFTGSIGWEKQFWMHQIEKDVYLAMVDTTFCLIRNPKEHELHALRIAGNFTARHLPWYQEYSSLNDEEKFFVEHSSDQSNFKKGYVAWLNEQRVVS